MKRINIALAVLLAGTVAANALVGTHPDVPNFDFLPEMMYSPAAEAYAASDLRPAGRVLQPPPAGTIARAASLVAFDATPADAVRAGEELTAPAVRDGDAARGAAVFGTFCVPCHGATGLGDGAIVKRGFPAPPSLLAPRALAMRDGQLFHVVTYGQGNMSGYASQIGEDDRWRAVAHVRHLQRSAK
jgi:mono/diheme cytochrome c family protein